MKQKLIAVATLCVSLLACGSVTVGVAVAAFGLAGVALQTDCASGGNGCSAALAAYAELVVTQATEDATVLESGSSTQADINLVLANLNTDLQSGQMLPGLTAGQQAEVKAIANTITALVPFVEALATTTPTPALRQRTAAATSPKIVLPPLTSKDKAALAKFRSAALKAKK